jgi:hypothetical protein
MTERLEIFIVLALALIQIAGVVCTILTRLAVEGRAQAAFQKLFLVSLLAVGGAALIAIAVRSQYGFSCGLTLALMAVGATLDLRRTKHSPAF